MIPEAWDRDFARGRSVFLPLLAAREPFLAHTDWPTLDEWNASFPRIVSAGGAPIRFVAQPPKRRRAPRDLGALYDERIYTRGEVQSRVPGWHDFFNMLVWASFPRTKRAINARQRAALLTWIDPSARRLPARRTREQDALATLDEGGLLLAVSRGGPLDAIHEAVLRADVAAVIAAVERSEARALLLGHAIYEHLVQSEAPVRAFARIVPIDEPLTDLDVVRRAVDRELARELESGASLVEEWVAAGLPVIDALFAQPSSS